MSTISMNRPDAESIESEWDRFSKEGEAIADVSDSAWQAIGDRLVELFPEANYGDLSPSVTMALDNALSEVVIEWMNNNVPQSE